VGTVRCTHFIDDQWPQKVACVTQQQILLSFPAFRSLLLLGKPIFSSPGASLEDASRKRRVSFALGKSSPNLKTCFQPQNGYFRVMD